MTVSVSRHARKCIGSADQLARVGEIDEWHLNHDKPFGHIAFDLGAGFSQVREVPVVSLPGEGPHAAIRDGQRAGDRPKAPIPAGTRSTVSPAGGNKMLAGSIERAQLYDRALTADEISASAVEPPTIRVEDILAGLSPEQLRERERLVAQLSLVRLRQGLLSGGPVYAVNPRPPEPTHVLARGNPAQPSSGRS